MRVSCLAVAASAAFLSVAQAQIQPVSRTSHWISNYSWYGPDGSGSENYDETATTWTSGTHRYGSTQERLILGAGSINVSAYADGTANDNIMQHSGFSQSSSYTGEFIFDLSAPATFSLAGALDCAYGSARVTFFDLDRGTTIFSALPRSLSYVPFSTSGSLMAGRYRLLLTAVGEPMGGGGPGYGGLEANLTIVPAPSALAVLGLALVAHRRRRA